MSESPEHPPAPRSTEARSRRARAARDAPRQMARSFVQLKSSVNPGVLVITVLVLAAVVVSVSQPLRNYFEQRAEIAEVNAKIDRQEAEKQALTEEIEKYGSEAYLKEQARTRPGVTEPGESAYRIISPKITGAAGEDAPGAGKSPSEQEYENSPWFKKLWDSVAVEPGEEAPGDAGSAPAGQGEDQGTGGNPEGGEQPSDDMKLPILPENQP